MKIIRNLLCALLSVGVLLCCYVSAAAAEPRITFVGMLTVFSSGDGTGSSALTEDHAFISFKNTSSQVIKIGALNVNPGHEITIGAWGTKPKDHEIRAGETWKSGIFYNVESHLVNYDDGLSNRVSLTMGVTMNDVITIRDKISNWGSYHYITNNCATFAVEVWNSVAPSNWLLTAGIINQPVTVYISIKSKSGYQTNRSIMNMTPIGYANSNGDFVSITLSLHGGGGGNHRSV